MIALDSLGRTAVPRAVASAALGALALVVVACGTPADGEAPAIPTTQQAPATTETDSSDTEPDSAPAAPSEVDTLATATETVTQATSAAEREPIPADLLVIDVYPVPPGSRPHDVAPARDGGIWYTAQGAAALGWLDPATGATRHIDLGIGSRPHGVIVGPDGDAWVTDSGLNAILRVDPATSAVTVYRLPDDRPDANLNTAAFDADGVLWFTGQAGVFGRVNPTTGVLEVFDAPRGRGPYGIAATPNGVVYFASLAGSYIGQIDSRSNTVLELAPPTPGQGARRVWSDSQGRIWVSEWNAGQLGRYDPATGDWTEWPLPGPTPQAYAVFVDDTDIVWVSDFGGNAIHRFDPRVETFTTFALPSQPSNVRQILGRPGEVWAPESAADQLIVIRLATE